MKYEVKLKWSIGEDRFDAKWFKVEAESEDLAKALVLEELHKTHPDAVVVNFTIGN